MTKNLQAIFENGVLRPLEPLQLTELQVVTVAITDEILPEARLDSDFAAAEGDDAITLEEVRQALAKINEPLTGDFVAERDER